MGAASRRALIAGGGVGGLTAALALSRVGWHVTVAERAVAFEEVGAGLQLSPNATRVLRTLDLLDVLDPHAVRPSHAVMRDGRNGRQIYRAELGAVAERRWQAPYLHIHRADLLETFVAAAREAGVDLVTDCLIESFSQDPQRVTVQMGQGQWQGELLIAADGLRSQLRAMIADPAKPRFTGQVAWRAVYPADALGAAIPARATVWTGPGRHLVSYLLRGGDMVNLVGVEETADWVDESWALAGDAETMKALFADWHPEVRQLLEPVRSTMKWGLFDRAAPSTWCDGRAALLGDACHPMLPFMAQGAAMAIEDAAVLAKVLRDARTGAEIASSLKRYETIRRPRTRRVQQISAANGELFHQQPGPSRALKHGMIGAVSRMAPGLAASRLDWLYGHDVLK